MNESIKIRKYKPSEHTKHLVQDKRFYAFQLPFSGRLELDTGGYLYFMEGDYFTNHLNPDLEDDLSIMTKGIFEWFYEEDDNVGGENEY